MQILDASSASCLVYTFKEGLLSRVGHDLQLSVARFSIQWSPDGTVEAEFDPASLRVDCALKRGTPDHRALSPKDKADIDERTRSKVLHTSRHPDIRFAGVATREDDGRVQVSGDLHLHGAVRPLRATAHPRGKELVLRVRLMQPDFGIVPFSALMGTLRIKPEVDVELRIQMPQA